MAKQIAMFNHKGGVGKTTTTFHLGWQLADMGKTVLLVDADPQANLTGMALGTLEASELEEFYEVAQCRNIRSGLAPAFESQPRAIREIECFPVSGRDGLFLMPGHIGLSEFDYLLAIAQGLSGYTHSLKNLPGAISYLLSITADALNADYILVDTSPSLSAFNQNLLMTSDFFIMPANPDYYSGMAIDTLVKVIPRWRRLSVRAQNSEILQNSIYPYPVINPKFLGTVIKSYDPKRRDSQSDGLQQWIAKINAKVEHDLLPALRGAGMELPQPAYESSEIQGRCLAVMPHFNSLTAKSQELTAPIYNLTEAQLQKSKASQKAFKETFCNFSDSVIRLTSYADSD